MKVELEMLHMHVLNVCGRFNEVGSLLDPEKSQNSASYCLSRLKRS